MATKNRKDELLAAYEAKLAEVNTACSQKSDVEGRLAELVNIEKEFRSIRESEVFAGLADTHQAIVLHHFNTISHKRITQEGVMTGVEKSEKRVQIDLKKFCEVKSLDLGWFYELQALNKRLTLRVAESIGVTAEEMRKINDSYNMEKLAREIKLGKTPTSNTQIVAHMQKVLDMLSPKEGKVNGHDLGYVMACYTKRNNKASLRVQCSKHTMLLSLMGDVFYRIATNGTYGVDYKHNAEAAAEDKDKDKAGKGSGAKAKTGSTGKAKTGSKRRTKTAKVEKPAEVSEPEPMTGKKDQPAAA